MKARPKLAICITAWGASQKEIAALPKAIKSLEQYFEVKVWPDIEARDIFESQSVSDRIASLNWAFHEADIVLPWKGGFNTIELLFNFDQIKTKKEAVFVGLSDNTVLTNAFLAKNRCRAWQGPNVWNWVKNPEKGKEWAEQLSLLFREDYRAVTAKYNQAGVKVLRSGTMTGKIWGGNNYSFDLLQGTEFCPDFTKPFILFMEGEDILKDQAYVWRDFIRNIDSILLQKGAMENFQGLVLGRFPDTYLLNEEELEAFVENRPYLKSKPIVYDFPCGHFPESLYLPLGENVTITVQNNKLSFNKIPNKK